MQDFFNLTMLVLAATASMLLGVLTAYAIFKVGFSAMRWHSRQPVPAPISHKAEALRVS